MRSTLSRLHRQGRMASKQPDLNPLNYHVWAGCWTYSTPETHNRRISRCWWDELPQEAIRKSLVSFRKRMCPCINTKGGHFEYELLKSSKLSSWYFCFQRLITGIFSALQTYCLKYAWKLVVVWFICLHSWKNRILYSKTCYFWTTKVEMIKFTTRLSLP